MSTDTLKCLHCGRTADVPESQFKYCPGCGVLGPYWQRLSNEMLSLYERDGKLSEALTLFRKASYVEAARAALISVEVEMKRLGKTESYGTALVDEVLSFQFDAKAQSIVREPVLKMNDLSSQTDRGEQEGIRLLIAGLFKGLRNSLMHNHPRFNAIQALSVIGMSNLLIDVLNNGSILNQRVCVWKRVKPNEQKQSD